MSQSHFLAYINFTYIGFYINNNRLFYLLKPSLISLVFLSNLHLFQNNNSSSNNLNNIFYLNN